MGRDLKLTANFKLSEFTNHDINDYQLSLLQNLANELQVVRNRLQEHKSGNREVSITIISGVRTMEDYKRLLLSGYPSQSSDHFCGLQMNCKPTIGAVDIRVNNCSMNMKNIALFIRSLVLGYDCSFGQVIYEKNPKTGSEWIHLSNDPKLIFRPNIASSIKRSQFLMSLDNGKTYQDLK